MTSARRSGAVTTLLSVWSVTCLAIRQRPMLLWWYRSPAAPSMPWILSRDRSPSALGARRSSLPGRWQGAKPSSWKRHLPVLPHNMLPRPSGE